MRYKGIFSILLVLVIATNLIYILSYIEDPLQKLITTKAVGTVGITVYETTESTPSTSGGGAASGGGGGGEPAVSIELSPEQLSAASDLALSISTESIKSIVKVGSSFSTEFSIKNKLNKPVSLNIGIVKSVKIENQLTGFAVAEQKNYTLENPELYFKLSQNKVSLQPLEEKVIKLTITARENLQPGTYVNHILIKGEGIEKYISLIVEVETKEVIFDASLEIPLAFQRVRAGSELVINPTIFNLADLAEAQVEVTYLILNPNGERVLELNENIFLTDQISFSKSLKLPSNLEPGRYIVSMHIKYKDSFGGASRTFEVIKDGQRRSNDLFAVIAVSFSIILIAFMGIILHRQNRMLNGISNNLSSHTRNVVQEYKRQPVAGSTSSVIATKMSRIKKSLASLKRSYQEGFISKKTYLESREKLNRLYQQKN